MPASRAAICGAGAALLLTLAACSASPSQPAKHAAKPSASPSAAAPAQLTVAQAGDIFAAFLAKFDRLPSDPALAGQLATGPEATTEEYLNGAAGYSPGQLTGERFVVPYLTSYPRWFLAAGSASDKRGFLFVMVQQSAGAPWREAADIYDAGGSQIMADLSYAGFNTSGLATPLAASEASLVMPPSAVPAAYSRYIDDLGSGPQARNFGKGAYTSGFVNTDKQAIAASATDGWRFTLKMKPAGQPVYGVNLAIGSVMIIFYTNETITWTALTAGASIGKNGTGLSAPPAQIAAYVHVSRVYPGLRVTATAIDENIAFVPPAGIGKIVVELNVGKALQFTKS